MRVCSANNGRGESRSGDVIDRGCWSWGVAMRCSQSAHLGQGFDKNSLGARKGDLADFHLEGRDMAGMVQGKSARTKQWSGARKGMDCMSMEEHKALMIGEEKMKSIREVYFMQEEASWSTLGLKK